MFIPQIAMALALVFAPTPVDHIHDVFGDLGDEVVMEAITVAWCESRLDPSAKNPTSSATGLFQITKRWQAHSNADPIIWSQRDALANVEFARILYDSRDGWGHWACYPRSDTDWTACVRGWVPDRWLSCRGSKPVPEEYRLLPEPEVEVEPPPTILINQEISVTSAPDYRYSYRKEGIT